MVQSGGEFRQKPGGLERRLCEAVSRIAQAKGDESQLAGHDAYVLWMDFQDPLLWALVPDLGQVRPFSTFRGAATSGAFWSAFYGRPGMPVFDSLSFESGDHSIYRMEFEGRFSRQSVLDFVIVSVAALASCTEPVPTLPHERSERAPTATVESPSPARLEKDPVDLFAGR